MKNNLKNLSVLIVIISAGIASCKKDRGIIAPDKATIENLEIGYGNNMQGVIGRDFHLDMDVVAASRIKDITVIIRQRSGETYLKSWSFETTWIEFNGVKNTNVHKHFDIDKEAPEGTYDFIIRVRDHNGAKTEEIHTITLISAENLPVNPEVYSFMLQEKARGFVYILNRGHMDPDNKGFKKGETIGAYIDISEVKGDGTLYALLIKKSAGHLPETVEDIDFSKAIVVDMREHKDMTQTDYFTNYLPLDGQANHELQELMIGAATDNRASSPQAITGEKAWYNGDYYFGIVYTNKTYNMSTHYYVAMPMTGF